MTTSVALKSEKPSEDRLKVIDALRGLALVGMLLVHFGYYVTTDDRSAHWLSSFTSQFAEERFYPLFALLFGVGFGLQFRRWGERPGFSAMYLRRMAALIGFAALLIATTGYHVLESYAFWGAVLLTMRRWSNRALLLLVLACAAAQPVRHFATLQWEKSHLMVEESNRRMEVEQSYWPNYRREEDRLRTQGTFAELASLRLRQDFGDFLRWKSYLYGYPLMMILLGVLAVRLRVFDEPLKHRRILYSIIVYGSIAGLVSYLVPPFGTEGGLRMKAMKDSLFFAAFNYQFQGLAYAALCVLWIAHRGIGGVFAMLAQAGRLSLTNYVMQVAVLETLFGTNALGLPLSAPAAVAGVVTLFAAQILFSKMWMSRFRYGPLEWLWRCATYAKWIPIRR